MVEVVKIKYSDNIEESILEAVNLLGSFKCFIKTGETVLLKPNFNSSDPFPASTDMNFLKAVVELVYGAGAKTVIIGDSSNVFLNTRQVMKKLGVFDLKNMDKPPWIYIFEEYDWLTKEIPGARYLKKVSLPKYLKQVDKLILLPCLKTHVLTKFTGSLKLSVGFVKRSERISFHLKHVQEKIAELNTVINPDLIIMDARKCFINKGPTHGEIREPGLILASTNRVAIDVEGIKIIQSFKGNSLIDVNPQKLPQIKRAEEIKN